MDKTPLYPMDGLPEPTLTCWGIPFIEDGRLPEGTMVLLDADGRVAGYIGNIRPLPEAP